MKLRHEGFSLFPAVLRLLCKMKKLHNISEHVSQTCLSSSFTVCCTEVKLDGGGCDCILCVQLPPTLSNDPISHVFNGQRDGYTPAGRTHPGCLCQLAPHKLQTQMKAMLFTAALNLRL